MWNMNVNVRQIVVGAFGKVSKKLEKRFDEPVIRGRIETIQTTYSKDFLRFFIYTADPRRFAVSLNTVKNHQFEPK